jgi:hypothetical protein
MGWKGPVPLVLGSMRHHLLSCSTLGKSCDKNSIKKIKEKKRIKFPAFARKLKRKKKEKEKRKKERKNRLL